MVLAVYGTEIKTKFDGLKEMKWTEIVMLGPSFNNKQDEEC